MKKKKPESFTKVTRDHFEERGWIFVNVEHFNTFANIRQDFGGFGDAIAFLPSHKKHTPGRTPKIVVLQICGLSDWTTREKKILKNGKALAWLLSGGDIYIVAWDVQKILKKDKAGAMRMQRDLSMKCKIITPSDFQKSDEILLEYYDPRLNSEGNRTAGMLQKVFRGDL